MKTVQDDLFGLFGIATVVRVLDTEDKGSSMFAGIDPVEQGGAGSPDVE